MFYDFFFKILMHLYVINVINKKMTLIIFSSHPLQMARLDIEYSIQKSFSESLLFLLTDFLSFLEELGMSEHIHNGQ